MGWSLALVLLLEHSSGIMVVTLISWDISLPPCPTVEITNCDWGILTVTRNCVVFIMVEPDPQKGEGID